MVHITQHEKREWARLAAAAFRVHCYALGTLFSSVAVLPAGTPIDVRTFDRLQSIYRHWLVFGELGG
jgi:hypothetical protein